MIPIYEPVDLWFACLLAGTLAGGLYSQMRVEKLRRHSSDVFASVALGTASGRVRHLVMQTRAYSSLKPAPVWSSLVGVLCVFALICYFLQAAFSVGQYAVHPALLMGWLKLLLTMGAMACLVPLISHFFVKVADWKMRKDIRKRLEVLSD